MSKYRTTGKFKTRSEFLEEFTNTIHMSMNQQALHLGVSAPTIKSLRLTHGYGTTTKSNICKQNHEMLMEMHKAGLTHTAMANELGVVPSTIHTYFKQLSSLEYSRPVDQYEMVSAMITDTVNKVKVSTRAMICNITGCTMRDLDRYLRYHHLGSKYIKAEQNSFGGTVDDLIVTPFITNAIKTRGKFAKQTIESIREMAKIG